MKKILFLITLMVTAATTCLRATSLSVENLTIQAGQNGQLAVSMTNTETNLSGFQFRLYLPEGLSIATNENGKFQFTLGTRIANHSLTIRALNDGGYQFIAYSMDGDAIAGTNGVLLSVPVVSTENFNSGNGTISDIRLTDLNANKTTCSNVSFTVTKAIPATGITLNKSTHSFNAANQTVTLTATVTPTNATNKSVTWTSSNTNVATVSSTGVVTAVADGTATITATTADGTNLTATCQVTVAIPVPATGISINKTTHSFNAANQTVTLTATVTPTNATNKSVTWTSSNTNVATVSSTGVVTAVADGTATITAKTADGTNLTATCQVTVAIPVPATGISINKTTHSFNAANQTVTLTATVTPANATNKNVTWTSSNTAVATVSSTGVVTAKANGTATITAKTADGTNLSATCTVTVSIPVPATGITLNKTSHSFNAANLTVTLTATVTPANATNKNVTWTSSNTAVATVSSTGVVTAKANGTATITAKTADGTNLTATCTVTVAIPVPATDITLSQSTLSFNAANQTATLTATVAPSNATNKSVTWTSSNTNVATVSSTGVVTANANGTATITAKTADGTNLTATCTVTVAIPVPATDITLSQSSLSFNAANQTATLTATVTPSNATNKSVTWTSSNTNVATVSSTGVVTAIADGTATIIATTADGTNLSATCEVTVAIPVPATGITLSQSTLSFNAANQTETLTATVTPSNATNKSVTWTSSDTSVATVSDEGVVTAVANGTATITATTADGTNLTATCTVTVAIPVPATSITLNQVDPITFNAANQTATLTATVTPANATNKNVTWTSSNTNVATVNENGVVTAIADGIATITATTTDGTNLMASCSVYVRIYIFSPDDPIIFDDNIVKEICVANWDTNGDVEVSYAEAAAVTSLDGVFEFSEILSFNELKYFTGITSIEDDAFCGCTQLLSIAIPKNVTSIGDYAFAECPSLQSVLIYIEEPISISSDVFDVGISENTILYVPAGCKAAYEAADNWSNFKEIFEMGQETILATVIYLSESSLSFNAINQTKTLSALVLPENATNKSVTWTSSNTAVATVSSTGVVTTKANGTATITAKTADGTNLTATCTVTVAIPVPATNITLSQSTLSFNAANQTATLTATVAPSNATNKSVTWTSSNTNVATVSSAGVVTAVAYGTATITATTADGTSITATCQVTFNQCYTAYLQNVESGLFLTAANEWNTQASIDETGIPIIMEGTPESGYTLDTKIYYDATRHYLNIEDKMYCDQLAGNWFFKEISNGIYALTLDNQKYIAYDGSSSVLILSDNGNDPKAQWRLVTEEMRKAELINATEATPLNATFLLPDANFSNENLHGNWQGSPTKNGEYANMNGEKFDTNFDVYQEITDVPNGFYVVKMQGFYREGKDEDWGVDGIVEMRKNGVEHLYAQLYVNEESMPVMSIFDEAGKNGEVGLNTELGYIPNSQSHASSYFSAGLYEHQLIVHVTDGTLRIGVRKQTEVYRDWTCFDNFRLTYCGTDIHAAAEVGSTFTAAVPCGEGTVDLTFKVWNSNPLQVIVSTSPEDIAGALTIPATVTDENGIEFAVWGIGDNAFNNRTNLTAVEMPESVTTIGGSAFYGCTGLTSVTILGDVDDIWGHGFENCTSLQTVTINGVTNIDDSAFKGCASLQSIVLPEGLTKIGEAAFHSSGLESISFPSTLTRVDKAAFRDCSALKTIDFNGCTATLYGEVFLGTAIEELVIPETVILKGWTNFGWCPELRSVEMKNINQTAHNDVFKACAKLETAILPKIAVMTTGYFENCTNLRSVTFLSGAPGNDGRQYCDKNFQDVPDDVLFIIPEGTAESYLKSGYKNLSDKSGLPLVREEFEAEAARITTMAEALNDGDKTALNTAITSARTTVNSTDDYMTIYAQIAAIKTAAKTFLTTASLPNEFDVTAAAITNPDFDRFQMGWKTTGGGEKRGWMGEPGYYHVENGDVILDYFIEAWNFRSYVNDGELSQTITSLPAGIYRLEADIIATNQNDANAEVTGVSLFAGNQSTPVATENQKPQHFSVEFTLDENGDCTIGLSINSTNANWVAMDNVRLIYYGEENDVNNMVYAENKSVNRGAEFELPIHLDNGEEEITAFQIDVELPEGVILRSATLSDRKADHGNPVPTLRDDGSYRLTTFSGSNSTFSGNEGTLLNLTIKVNTNVSPGNYTIMLKNIEITTISKAIELTNSLSELTVLEALTGDANGDGKVSIFDAVQIVNHILGNTPETFIESAADVDGNGKITIFDAVSTVNIILNQSSANNVKSMLDFELDPQ